MFKTIVFSAFGAALAICLGVTAMQFVTTEPLILHAERYEGGAPAHDHAPAASAPHESVIPAKAGIHGSDGTRGVDSGWSLPSGRPKAGPGGRNNEGAEAALIQAAFVVPVHDTVTAEEEEWAPADSLERSLLTGVANLVIGFAISLMLLAAMVIKGDPIDARRGLLWGIAGFAAVSLLPALGLPPELPGTPAADIYARQLWWLGAAAASAGGIGLLVFGRNWGLLALGLVLVLAPHVIGAPEPPSYDVAYPGALAGEFVVASLVASALLWSLAGLVSGALYQRFSAQT
jgi:cobalt transporter subunit CbtA